MKYVVPLLIVAAMVVLTVVGQPQLAALLGSALLAKIAIAVTIAAIGMALNALLVAKPKGLNQAIFDRLQATVQPTAPRKFVFGRTAAGADERFHEKAKSGGIAAVVGGIIGSIFGGSSAKKGDYLFRIIALASHRVHAVKEVYLEDELCWNGSTVVGKFSADGGLAIVPISEGTSANAAAWGSGSYWNASSKFTGCAYLKLAHKLDSKIYPDGVPSRLTTIVEGCPVYDPRLDSTNGGSGPHRPSDNSTWTYYSSTNEIGRNPALCLLAYLLGWKINGKVAWGMGIAPERINLANFITYANVCDEPVAVAGGGTVKRYQCDYIGATTDTHEATINAISAAMGTARMVDTNGVYQLVGGFDDLDGPIYAFNEDDLLGQYEWRPSVLVRERYNQARGRFANPDKLFQPDDWGEVSIDPLADGIPRTVVLDLSAVSRPQTCQRIAKQHLVRNAFTGTFAAAFGPAAFSVQVGSLVSLSIQKEGWNAKLFRVVDYSEEASLIFQLTLQEESAVIYAWDTNEEVPLPADVRPPAYDPNETVDVDDLVATALTETTSNGGLVSRITVEWTEPDAAAVSINIEHSTDGVVWSSAAAAFDPGAETFIFNAPVGGAVTQVRARFRMFSGIFGVWTTTSVTAAAGSDGGAIVGYLEDEAVTFAADSAGNIL